jgi:RNA polymerase sigma-70 factor, ECF subfamily
MSRTASVPRVVASPVVHEPAPARAISRDSGLAAETKALVVAGDRETARERFGELVASQQRRAVRIAYQYLRDPHDADEAVQDAFVKVFTHITSYREELPFEVWFTRILVNGCLDLRKARARRLKWVLPVEPACDTGSHGAEVNRSAEEALVAKARMKEITAAVEQLPDRQRSVFVLCHFSERTTNEISEILGMSEATVRVHLFRAVHKLRRLLGRAV